VSSSCTVLSVIFGEYIDVKKERGKKKTEKLSTIDHGDAGRNRDVELAIFRRERRR